MDESIIAWRALTETRTQLQRARLRPSQPLQIVAEEEEDETDGLLPNGAQTPLHAIGEPSRALPTDSRLDREQDSGEDVFDNVFLDDFFTNEEEMELSPPPPSADLGPQLPRLADTFLSHDPSQLDPTISLRTVLDVIKRHRSLQDARILRVDSYQNGVLPYHRFIILQLEREGREQIWLRIDRRRDKTRSLWNFALNAGASPANDRARFSADKGVLSEGLDTEHSLKFDDVVPTLGDLRWVFFAILQVLERYELLGANCWFMVSFIYECLGEVFHGSVIAQFLYLRKGSEEVRHEMKTAARLVIAFPFEEIPTRLVQQYDGIKNFYHAMLNHHVDTTDGTVMSVARSLFDLRQIVPDRIALQNFISSSAHGWSGIVPPHLERVALRLARLFDGGSLNKPQSCWHYTFDLFLLNSFSNSPVSRAMIPADLHRLHVTTCLEILKRELCFNICKFSSSFLRNEDVPNLEALKEVNISSHLSYACRHWADQVSKLETLDVDLLGMLSGFFRTHFLHWLEVMSNLALSPVDALKNLVSVHIFPFSKDLAGMIQDAQHFVELFEIPILKSVPHIYVSALTFTPTSSKLFSNLRQLLGPTAVAQSGALSNWLSVGPIIHAAPGAHVLSLAFSPDGRFLVSGSSNKTVQLWEVVTGDAIGEPLSGHEDWVRSVAFSPDGARIASGLDDQTIRLWDVATRRQIGQPLKGHTSYVMSVAFLPNGAQLASGSWDNTVCRWDARTGRMIGLPSRGHSDKVNSVAFSSDGTRIASASDDRTIRIWDAETGTPIGKPMEGHSGSVWWVAFAPDDTQIASASEDRTVRRWDARTGQTIGEPSRGHAAEVNCVAFSPDGQWIASGSYDITVRLWDACTGEAVGEPLNGNSDWIWTVAFSPDGCTFASGLWDGTICLWQCGTGGSDNLLLSRFPINPSSHPHQSTIALHSSSQIPHYSLSPNLPPCESLQLREDGWISGPNSELILWLPFGLRNKMPFSERAIIDNIDFSNFQCGTEWSNCWQGSGEAHVA